MVMKKIVFIIFTILILNTCSQEPLTPLEDPTKYSHTWNLGRWVIYEDALNTLGGDILYYPSAPGKEIMYLENRKDGTAYSGEKYFRLYWSGGKIWWEAQPPDNPTDRYEWSFAGISFIVATRSEYYDITEPLDLTEGKYTKITFYARGKLSEGYHVKFEGPNGAINDNITNLSENWQKYEIELKDLNNIKDFFKVTIYYPAAEGGAEPGKGGYVDFDLVTYEK